MPSPSSRSAERVKRLQAQAAKRERNRRLAIAGTAIAVVVIVVAVLVVAKLAGGSTTPQDAAAPPQTDLSQVVAAVSSVPPATLDAVGAGSATNPPRAVAGATALTAGGKPEVLYMGGEFCPFCAATRWGVVVALSRFGTFHNLGLMTSSSTDSYPDTSTLTFHGASYASPHLAFHGYELSDRNQQKLDTPPASDNAAFDKYDNTPYTSTPGTIPFIDIAGRYFLYGSAYNPQVLQGLTHLQIANDLKDPSSPVAQAINGEANQIAAAVCTATDQQPTSVCSSTGVTTAATKLGTGG